MSARTAGGLHAGLGRGEAMRRLAASFAAAGIESAALDARVLVAGALGVEPDAVVLDAERSLDDRAAAVAAAARRRLAGEPVARILGRREFWSLELALSPATLVPRPETETVVAAVLARRRPAASAAAVILDLGTGSGCILLALLSELEGARGLGVDLEPAALRTARENARRHGLDSRAAFAAMDWAAAVRGPFDVIVANPPYVPTSDIMTLSREVRCHDPLVALDGGGDGLDAYRAIVPRLPGLLAADGVAALEVGQGQAGAVQRLAREAGLAVDDSVHDLSGTPRVVTATR